MAFFDCQLHFKNLIRGTLNMEKLKATGHLWLAIIAGGQGTRLFPISYDGCPKQFCRLDAKNTFIQATARRFINFGIKPSRIVVITTNSNQTILAQEQLSILGILNDNIYQIDPNFGYAKAMALASNFIAKLDKEAVVINTPADQHIVADDTFYETLGAAIDSARAGTPTIVGVKITDLVVAMGCGHAQYNPEDEAVCKKIISFIEKPNRQNAEYLLRTDSSACNTGINIWQARQIVSAVDKQRVNSTIALSTDELMHKMIENFGELKIAVGNFAWYDCGTLKALFDISHKTVNHKNANLGGGEIYRWGCRRSLFYAPEGIELHAAGIEDSAVVINSVNDKMVAVVVKLDESQAVRILADDYSKNKDFLTADFSMGARNNHVPRTHFSTKISVGFVGVKDHTVTANKYPDGRIVFCVTSDASTLED